MLHKNLRLWLYFSNNFGTIFLTTLELFFFTTLASQFNPSRNLLYAGIILFRNIISFATRLLPGWRNW